MKNHFTIVGGGGGDNGGSGGQGNSLSVPQPGMQLDTSFRCVYLLDYYSSKVDCQFHS